MAFTRKIQGLTIKQLRQVCDTLRASHRYTACPDECPKSCNKCPACRLIAGGTLLDGDLALARRTLGLTN